MKNYTDVRRSAGFMHRFKRFTYLANPSFFGWVDLNAIGYVEGGLTGIVREGDHYSSHHGGRNGGIHIKPLARREREMPCLRFVNSVMLEGEGLTPSA